MDVCSVLSGVTVNVDEVPGRRGRRAALVVPVGRRAAWYTPPAPLVKRLRPGGGITAAVVPFVSFRQPPPPDGSSLSAPLVACHRPPRGYLLVQPALTTEGQLGFLKLPVCLVALGQLNL